MWVRVEAAGIQVRHGVMARRKPDSRMFFVDVASSEIKALSKNLSDRTDPLWDDAVRWIRPGVNDRYEFRIKRVARVG